MCLVGQIKASHHHHYRNVAVARRFSAELWLVARHSIRFCKANGTCIYICISADWHIKSGHTPEYFIHGPIEREKKKQNIPSKKRLHSISFWFFSSSSSSSMCRFLCSRWHFIFDKSFFLFHLNRIHLFGWFADAAFLPFCSSNKWLTSYHELVSLMNSSVGSFFFLVEKKK